VGRRDPVRSARGRPANIAAHQRARTLLGESIKLAFRGVAPKLGVSTIGLRPGNVPMHPVLTLHSSPNNKGTDIMHYLELRATMLGGETSHRGQSGYFVVRLPLSETPARTTSMSASLPVLNCQHLGESTPTHSAASAVAPAHVQDDRRRRQGHLPRARGLQGGEDGQVLPRCRSSFYPSLSALPTMFNC
jgi:hypothetical protein